MLEPAAFKFILENAPLVSIDICLVHDGKILLGQRTNEPLKDIWFTPGGRIFKNESWQECIFRVIGAELGLAIDDPLSFTLMGVWDHFYENSVMDARVSTHYVNLPHYLWFDRRPILKHDDQHIKMNWFDLQKVATGVEFHRYMKIYASWLIKEGF
jgi:colanic acid biosynthesis protein WcaH